MQTIAKQFEPKFVQYFFDNQDMFNFINIHTRKGQIIQLTQTTFIEQRQFFVMDIKKLLYYVQM